MEASAGEETVIDKTPAAGPDTGLSGTSKVNVLGTGEERPDRRWSKVSTAWTEHAQDIVSAGVALILIVLAATILIAAVVNFFHEIRPKGLTLAATDLLDQVLLVLIVVEIVHTVILSLRAHALAAQPFLVVGLVAVIRRVLFVLGSSEKVSAGTLGLYIGMIAVFVASLVAIEIFGGRRQDRGDSPGLH